MPEPDLVGNVFERVKRRVRHLVWPRLPDQGRPSDAFDRFEDRRLLLEVIFPYLLADPGMARILFVGCDWYTEHYASIFDSKEYWTLEVDAEKSRYGARRHIVDALRNLPRHVAPGYFDAIVCNGVFMTTAIETREEAEPSFHACQACLRRGGLFVLGWNDTDELRPYPPEESEALAQLGRFIFPPLATDRHVTDTGYRHVYSFFVRP